MNAKPYDWPTYHGYVARVKNSNGYGFIAPGGGGKHLFFHAQSVVDNIFDELSEGDSVAFEVENGSKGPAATSVRRNGGGDEYIGEVESEPVNSVSTEFRIVINDFCKRLAILISKDPEYLRHVEWRDLERVIAEAFSGMGFNVLLTPASKDGGKDIVISFPWNGRKQEYYIEIKHWVSGKKVGLGIVNEFVNIVTKSKIDGGLFLSSSGFKERLKNLPLSA